MALPTMLTVRQRRPSAQLESPRLASRVPPSSSTLALAPTPHPDLTPCCAALSPHLVPAQAPLFVGRHNKTIIAPSWTSYPWLGPVLLQLRDLTVFVLVALGIVLPEDKTEFVELIFGRVRAIHR